MGDDLEPAGARREPGVEVDQIEGPGNQRPGFLGVPGPVDTPGLLGAERPGAQPEAHQGKGQPGQRVDRFARAFFFVNAVPKTANMDQAVASVFGVIRGVSVPLGITTPGQPNIASTYWRTFVAHKNKVYFFDSATSPTVFWVPIGELDLKEGAPVKKLPLVGGQTYSGSAASKFEPSEPFAFLPAPVK